MAVQYLGVLLFGFVKGPCHRGPIAKLDFFSGMDAEAFGINFQNSSSCGMTVTMMLLLT